MVDQAVATLTMKYEDNELARALSLHEQIAEQSFQRSMWQTIWSFTVQGEAPESEFTGQRTNSWVITNATQVVQTVFYSSMRDPWQSEYQLASNVWESFVGTAVPTTPRILQECRRNFCTRPWLDEVSFGLLMTYQTVGQPSEGQWIVITRPQVTRVTTEEETLDSWNNYLKSHWDELFAQYRGKYVAIWNGRVYDNDSELSHLAQRVYDKLGYQPIFMPYIGEREKIVEFLSPG